jgi:hypothetical protein
MDYYCRVVSVGYDWARRWNVYDGGDTDCSALVITCLKEAGFDTGGATYTGNMSTELCARGWVRLAPDLSTAIPGDILLNDANHVAAVLWGEGLDATIGQASIGETGDVYGNQPGDQTGWETNETAIYNYPWDCILRYTGPDESEDDEMAITVGEIVEGIMNHDVASPDGGTHPVWEELTWTHHYAKQTNEKASEMLDVLKSIDKKLDSIGTAGVDVNAIAKTVSDNIAARMRK